MPSYNLIKQFSTDVETDSLSLSASALMVAYRLGNPITYSRATRSSLNTDLRFATDVKDRIEIVDDIRSVQVTSNKRSHQMTMSAALLPSTDWEAQLLPGDFVFVWLAQDVETIQSVRAKLEKGEAANGPMDGLKFFGRVQSCRKKRITNGATGQKTVNYSLSAVGFSELDMTLFYEPYMANGYKGAISSWMHTLGLEINKLIEDSQKDTNGGIETHVILPALYNTLYKTGAPVEQNTGSPIALTAGLDERTMFMLPPAVASVFGVYGVERPRWADLMELVVGVQKFTSESAFFKRSFVPNGMTKGQKVHFTGTPLMGTFLTQPHVVTGQKTAWSMLETFVNRAVNEMFVALKVNADGKVVPTLTVRQLPYSSDMIDETFTPKDRLTKEQREEVKKAKAVLAAAGGPETSKGKKVLASYDKRYGTALNPARMSDEPKPQMFGITRYTEVPRWIIPDLLIREDDIGRSDQGRINFIHVYGEGGLAESLTKQFVRDNPIRDDLDIARSGLRPLMATVPCSPKDVVFGGPAAWMNLLADIQMNAHLALNGIVNTHGIVAPIAPGDNIQFNGIIGHLEAVNHAFSVNVVGTKSFMTSLEFSHGIAEHNGAVGNDADWFGVSNPLNAYRDPATTIDHTDPTVSTPIDTPPTVAPDSEGFLV